MHFCLVELLRDPPSLFVFHNHSKNTFSQKQTEGGIKIKKRDPLHKNLLKMDSGQNKCLAKNNFILFYFGSLMSNKNLNECEKIQWPLPLRSFFSGVCVLFYMSIYPRVWYNWSQCSLELVLYPCIRYRWLYVCVCVYVWDKFIYVLQCDLMQGSSIPDQKKKRDGSILNNKMKTKKGATKVIVIRERDRGKKGFFFGYGSFHFFPSSIRLIRMKKKIILVAFKKKQIFRINF